MNSNETSLNSFYITPYSWAKLAFTNLGGLLKTGGFYMVSENFVQPNLAISLKILKDWGFEPPSPKVTSPMTLLN